MNYSNHTTFTIDLEQDGFSKNPFFHGIIAEVPEHLKSRDGEKDGPSVLLCIWRHICYLIWACVSCLA